MELNAEEGEEVLRDDALTRIDPRDFGTDLRNAESQLARAQASLRRAQREYHRILRIRKSDPGAASELMVVQRMENRETVKADIAALAYHSGLSQNSLDGTYLRAPYDGIVSRRYFENFKEASATEPVVRLDDINQFEIIINISEMMIATLRGREDQTDFFAEFVAAPGKVYPIGINQYSTRALDAWSLGRIAIPDHAIFASEEDIPHLLIVDKISMTVRKTPIVTGQLTGSDEIEVIDGLELGQSIAVTGVTSLKERIKI